MCRRSRKAKRRAIWAQKCAVSSSNRLRRRFFAPQRVKSARRGAGSSIKSSSAAFGGLDGVAAHLDHVAALGADARVPDAHLHARRRRTNTTPPTSTPSTPRFGGEAAFDRLVAACRARGLGLILDGVFNHVGEGHRWRREHPDWFSGSDWRGHSQPARARHDAIRRCGAPAARWSRAGPRAAPPAGGSTAPTISGPASPASWREAARDAGAVDGVIGEVMGYGAGWARPGGLDGVMNYWLRSAALALASAAAPADSCSTRSIGSPPRADAGALQQSWYAASARTTRARLATALDDDDARIRQALALAFAYPGVPMIYYGDEIGMHAAGDPAQPPPAAAGVDVGPASGARCVADAVRAAPRAAGADARPLCLAGAAGQRRRRLRARHRRSRRDADLRRQRDGAPARAHALRRAAARCSTRCRCTISSLPLRHRRRMSAGTLSVTLPGPRRAAAAPARRPSRRLSLLRNDERAC